jgi:predicted transcriptional regulator
MLDTQEGIRTDTKRGAYPRLTPAAIERAKTVLNISDLDSLGEALGFSRPGFWRARHGHYDPRLSHARRIARQLGMPLNEVFEDGIHA